VIFFFFSWGERGERPLSLPRGEEREAREREREGGGRRKGEGTRKREREREGERDAQKKRVPEVICEAVT